MVAPREADTELVASPPVQPEAVISAAFDRVLATGRALDLIEPDSDRLRQALADAIHWDDAEDTAAHSGSFTLGSLTGRAYRFGHPTSFKPVFVQIRCRRAEGVGVLTWEDRLPIESAAPLRVTPLKTVLLVGADEDACALVSPLRVLGFNILAAEMAAVANRDSVLDLADRGVRVFDSRDPSAIASALTDVGGACLVIEGYSGDTVLTPERTVERAANDAEAANRALTEGVGQQFGCPVLLRDAASTADGDRLDPLVSLLAKLLSPLRGSSSEAIVDLLLPTTLPYAEPNRHATDGPVVRRALDLEGRVRESLGESAPALAIHQRFGPWTTHVLVEATLRGGQIDSHAYRKAVEQSGSVWLAEASDVVLDDPAIQNLLANRLGLSYWFWPMASVVPLTEASFRVTCLAPVLAATVPQRLRWAIAAAGLASPANVSELVDRALDGRTPAARFQSIFGTPAPEPVDDRPSDRGLGGEAPEEKKIMAASGASGPGARGERPSGPAFRAADGEQWSEILEDTYRQVRDSGRLTEMSPGPGDALARFLIGRHLEFEPDPDAVGRARAPFTLGTLEGVRVRFGSPRVPDARRITHAIVWRRDEEPRPVVLAPGRRPGDPIVAVPLAALLVLGFGNISGDAGVLAQRLGFWVTAFNRSPNERARFALEHGIACYEFDESFTPQGERQVHDTQGEAFAAAGLPLAGTLRDALRDGVIVAHTGAGRPVRARLKVIVDGLFGTVRHPVSGATVKVSEYYKELLLDDAEAAGIPTIYEGANAPQVVARGRVVSQDLILQHGVPVESVLPRNGDAFQSVQCVSCNTTNLWTLSLALTGLSQDAAPALDVGVLLLRKINDQYVGEHKQATGTQGMLVFTQPKYVRDLWQFVQGIDDAGVRDRETAAFGRVLGSFSALVGHQPGTDLHFGILSLRRRDGLPLPADAVRSVLSDPRLAHLQLLDLDERVSQLDFLRRLYFRMGFRNLYVHPAAVLQTGNGVSVIFSTPHLHNVKLNTLTFASVLAGLVPADADGVAQASDLVDRLLRVADQKRQIAHYYPPRHAAVARPAAPAPSAQPRLPVYTFGDGEADAVALEAGMRRQLLGGKGAGLSEMGSIRVRSPRTGVESPVPVPPGYTVTTEQAKRFFDNGYQLPDDLVAAIDTAQARLERVVGRKLGDADDPLLVSVRSGARISMPGMMDTVLNLGLNDRSVEGLARASRNPRFAWDSYARFVEMFGDVVCGVDRWNHFRPLREQAVTAAGGDEHVSTDQLRQLVRDFQRILAEKTGQPFPQDPYQQLRMAIEAVFSSSFNERALTYRRIHELPDDTLSAANVVAMVFGNKGSSSGTGVAFTRDPLTGEHVLNGEYLTDAQGEDVVAGVRTGRKLGEMSSDPALSDAAAELEAIAVQLERHYKNALDIEFTIEDGKLWILQSRGLDARSGRASLRIVTDMVHQGILTPAEAILKFGDPERLIEVMQPIFDPAAELSAEREGRLLARGIAASVGAASGAVVFSSHEAAAEGRRHPVILVRPETSPEDIEGMEAAHGILTSRGGRTSHAAVVARGMGKAAVVGASALNIDELDGSLRVDGHEIRRGEVVSIDGSTGTVYRGRIPLIASPVKRVLEGQAVEEADQEVYRRFVELLEWAAREKTLEIRANADTPADVAVSLRLGAEGVGLLRTEHAVLGQEEQRVALGALLMASGADETQRALAVLEPFLRQNTRDIFREFQRQRPDQPAHVTVRFFDPVVNEFLPGTDGERGRIAQLLQIEVHEVERRAERMREINPMLGHRGVRLVIESPEHARMQARAAFEAAADVAQEGGRPVPEIEIPLVIGTEEVQRVSALVRETAETVMRDRGVDFDYKVGVMVETPAGVRTADQYAPAIGFISFGMNDLTQTVLAISRDDAGKFMRLYTEEGIFGADPFRSIDMEVVGSFVKEATERARSTNPSIWVGSAGDIGGDPPSVEFFQQLRFNGVSASPWLIPISILAAAQANLKYPRE